MLLGELWGLCPGPTIHAVNKRFYTVDSRVYSKKQVGSLLNCQEQWIA